MKKLMELWVALLNKLHLYTLSQHNRVCELAASMYEIQIKGLADANEAQTVSITELEAKVRKLTAELASVKAERDELASAFDPIQAERDSLREQIQAYKDAAMENATYVKDTQKQLSELLKSSEAFGFPNSRGIPGSTSIRTIDVEQDGKSEVLIRGRTIVSDDITQEINAIPDMGTKIHTVMAFMEKYGVFTKIARDMFSYGAVQCVLGYNGGNTNYELYYEIVSHQANNDSVLVVRNPERNDQDNND